MHNSYSLTHTKQLSLATFCDKTEGIGVSFWTHENGQTDMEVKIVI